MRNVIFILLLSGATACGTTETTSQGGTGNTNGSGGTGSGTTGASVITWKPSADEPIQSATYMMNFTPNSQFTTCTRCDVANSGAIELQYEGYSTYTVTTPTSTFSVEQSTLGSDKTLAWQTPTSNALSAVGCPGTTSGQVILILHPHQMVGAYQYHWNAQACNGYSAYSCTCAYDVQSISYSNAH